MLSSGDQLALQNIPYEHESKKMIDRDASKARAYLQRTSNEDLAEMLGIPQEDLGAS